MRVLIACEFSGIVRDAFISLGHEAYSCDLIPTESPGPHFQQDCLLVAGNKKWDLIIAHPPCTYLCSSGLHWNSRRPERFKKTEIALNLVRRLMEHECPRICIENPIGCISTRIRKPDQIIQPYQFGENASKKTCLWLKGLPLLKEVKFVEPEYFCLCGARFKYSLGKCGCPYACGQTARPIWGNQTPTGQNKLGPSDNRAMERSRTFQGIADAMAEQWGVIQ